MPIGRQSLPVRRSSPAHSDARVTELRHPPDRHWRPRGDSTQRLACSMTNTSKPRCAGFSSAPVSKRTVRPEPATVAELNVSPAQRIGQLRVNLDRGRVLLQDLPREFIVVNIAGFNVYFVRGEQVIWNARAQVGKPYRRTPIFRSEISYLVLNPTWTVPPGIIQSDILPQASRDPQSLPARA